MAISVNDYGPWGNLKVASTTHTISPGGGGASAVGDMFFLLVARDNISAVTGSFNEVTSITSDTRGNTWTKLLEYTTGQGGAGNGVTISVWYTINSVAFNDGSAYGVTLNFATPAPTAFSWVGVKVWSNNNSTLNLFGSTAVIQATGNNVPSLSLTGLNSSTTYAVIRAIGLEGAYVVPNTATSGWFDFAPNGTSGGSGATNISTWGEYDIVSGVTSATSDPAWSNNVDNASIMFAVFETAPPVNSSRFLAFF